MKRRALFHIHAQGHCVSLTFLCMHLYERMFILYVYACWHLQYMSVCHCASMHLGDSLITEMAWIGEGLQLDGWLCDFPPCLGLNDSPIDVFLEVDKAPVVSHCLPGQDVCVLHKIGVPDSVSTHDIVHMHADGVADFRRQGRCGSEGGGGPGLAFPG